MSAPSKTTAEGARVGCFQIVLLFLLAVNYVIVSMSHALPVFHNYTPKFYCESTAAGTNRTYGCVNSESFDNFSLLARVWGSDDNFTSCPIGYTWETENSERSVVVDWRLICERSHLSYLGPTIYYVGVAIGAWVAGLVADRIGRLPVLAICLYTQGTMAVATYIVQSYPAFLVLRGLQGLFAQGLQNSTYILVLELFPKKMRTLAATTMEIGWALGLVILAALSYFIPDWRVLQLAVSVPTALTVLYIWIIPESPRWLLAKGKSTEADIALEKIAKYNACCSGRSRRGLVAEADNNANTKPVKPERKSRLIRAVDETRNSTNGESGESTNLLTPPNPVKRKSRGSSIRAIAENLEKRLSVSNGDTATTELAESREDHSEMDVSVEASTRCHRESRVSSTSGENCKIEESESEEAVKIILNSDRDGKFGESENDEAPTIEKSSTSGLTGEAGQTENDEALTIETSSTSGPNCEADKPESDEVPEIKILTTSGRNGKIPTAENEDVPTITKLPEVAAEEPIAARNDEIRDIEQVQEIDTIAACSPRRSRYLTKHLTVMAYQWFTASVSQSVVLGIPTELSGNRHVNFAIGGCFEAAVYVITYFVLTRYGRRLPMSLCQLLTGGICITVGILAVSRSSTVGWIGPTSTIFLLIGRATVVCSLATAYLFTVEIFPTVIRGACLGLCAVSGMFGSLTAPYILSLKNHTTITVPLTLIGVLSLISGLVCLILPETVNERLPDTAQQMGRKSTRNKIGVAGCDYVRAETEDKPLDHEVLREKLFSEDWVDAGNGIIVNFTENKN